MSNAKCNAKCKIPNADCAHDFMVWFSPCLSGLLSLSAGGRELVLWCFALGFSCTDSPCRMLLSHTCSDLPGSLMKTRVRRRAARRSEACSRSHGRLLFLLSLWAKTRGSGTGVCVCVPSSVSRLFLRPRLLLNGGQPQ